LRESIVPGSLLNMGANLIRESKERRRTRRRTK
jgi:hypothetical protein